MFEETKGFYFNYINPYGKKYSNIIVIDDTWELAALDVWTYYKDMFSPGEIFYINDINKLYTFQVAITESGRKIMILISTENLNDRTFTSLSSI